jgi:hypothetical protein
MDDFITQDGNLYVRVGALTNYEEGMLWPSDEEIGHRLNELLGTRGDGE